MMPGDYKTKGMADAEFNAMSDKIAQFLDFDVRDDGLVDGKRAALWTWIQGMKAGRPLFKTVRGDKS